MRVGRFGHVLIIKHALCYCEDVAPESEDPVSITEWNYDPRGSGNNTGPRPYSIATHSDFPGLNFRLEYDDDLNLKSVAVSASDESPGITARMLRKFPFGAVDASARTHMARWWRAYDEIRPEAARSASPISKKSMDAIDIRRPGRRGRPDIEYAELARDYVRIVATPGVSPLKRLKAERQFLSESQLRNLLYEARRRGLLTDPPQKGKAGGDLTHKALSLLEQAVSPSFPEWTPEQFEEARERDKAFRDLWAQQRAGEITPEEAADRFRKMTSEFISEEN
jgi:hypothetical protein